MRVLARVGRRGGLGPGARALLRRWSGYDQVLTRRRSVLSALDLADLTVPYGPPSTAVGLGAFPLSLDGPDHDGARQRIAVALAGSVPARQRGVVAASDLALDAVAGWRTGGAVDVVASVIDPCIARWAEAWYGLPGEGERLLELSRLVAHAIFFDPDPSTDAGRRARAHVVERSRRDRAALADQLGRAPVDSLGAALLAGHDGDGAAAASDLVGLTVGPLALGAWALANVVDELLGRPGRLAGAEDPRVARSRWTDALGARPPLPGVVRDNPTSRRVVGHRRQVLLPEGRVLIATACAAHLDGGGDPPLAFGSGAHACLGREPMGEVAAAVLAALASVAPTAVARPAGGLQHRSAPHGAASWPFPSGLLVRPTTRR